MDWSFADQDLVERSWMEELTRVAKSRVKPSIVCWSGSTKLERNATEKVPGTTEDKNISLPGC